MIPSFNIQPGESPQAVAERRKIALLLMKEGMDTSPIRSPWQGAARVAQAMMGGMELNRADQSERNAGKRLADALLPENGGNVSVSPSPAGSTPAPAVSPRPAAPLPSSSAPVAGAPITSPQSAPEKELYSPNEQSPLDPVPGAMTPNMQRLTRAIQAGESGGRYDVMYTPPGSGPTRTFTDFSKHPNSPAPIPSGPHAGDVSTAAGGSQIVKSTWDRAQKALNLPDFSPGNQNAATAYIANEDYKKRTGRDLEADMTQAGNDPAKLERIARALAPTWTSLPGGIEQNAGGTQFAQNARSDAITAQSRIPPQAPAQAPAAPVQDPMRNSPQIPPEMQAKLRALIMDPATRDYGLQLASQYIKPSQATFGVIGKDPFGNETYGWIDPLRRQTFDQQGRPAGAPSAGAAGGPQTEVGPNGQLRIMGPEGWIDVKPGQDPKVVRELATKAGAKGQLPATFEDTAKVRGEVRQLPSYKNFAEAAPIYKSMLSTAGNNSKASDLNLVYGLGKIFDPGSVVREGEMIMVKNTAGLPDWLQGAINGLNGGQALTPETRKAILREAKVRIDSYQQMFNQDAEQYRGIAQREKMNVDDVVPNFGDFPEWAGPPENPKPGSPSPQVGTAPSMQTATNPKTGERIYLDPQTGQWKPFA